uniref:Neuronal acetylcholine receptor subunit alpha-3-like n=1 Tax=Saccoglossus kowalevskii TaxID=10224 RepID=A0ABM0N176_SACKO|nr:PREDICTED: neuronal acetylcholine receptor subunit alpha-3-like [Saccoglossus kowalevskii]
MASFTWGTVTWTLLAVLLIATQDLLASVDHIKLRNYLFNNRSYDPTVRPIYDSKTITELELQFFLSQVLNVDERLQTLKMNVWLTIRWKDEFLLWDPADFNGISNFKISKDKVWMPDIWLYQNADNKYEDFTINSQCLVQHYGEVLWAAPVIIKSHCKMDVWNFPFDRQTCNVTFGPWLHNSSELSVNGTGSSSFFEGDTEWQLWDLTTHNYKYSIQYYPDYPFEYFSKVDYVVYLKRLPTYYVFYLIMPCTLIAAITLLGFFLPVESGEKIGLGQYYAAVMVLVSLSLAMSVAVLNLHFRGPDSPPVPPWMRRFMLGKVARFVMIRQVSKNKESRKGYRKGYLKDNKLEFLPMMDLTDCDVHRVNGLPLQARRLAHHSPKQKFRRKQIQSNNSQVNANIKTVDENVYFLRELLHEVKDVKEMLERQKTDEEYGSEWKQVALVVDRVFLFLYVVGSLATSLIILFQVDYDSGPSPLEIQYALENG